MASNAWRNRIVGEAEVDPNDLLAHPDNWRVHPQYQQNALEGVLDGIGWVQRIIVNQRTGFLIDGHARVGLALRKGEATVPVLYVDLTDDEERQILATFDPISAMAGTDQRKLDELLASIESVSGPALAELLDSLASGDGLDPEDFEQGPATLVLSVQIPAELYDDVVERLRDYRSTHQLDSDGLAIAGLLAEWARRRQ